MVTRLASYPVRLMQWGLVQWYALGDGGRDWCASSSIT